MAVAVCHDRALWLVYRVAYCDSCHGHSCPVSCLAVPHIQWPREIPDFTNFTDYKLSSLLCCLKSHLSIFSSFYLSCITPILPGFCLLLHTSSVFFLSSCCSKISVCCHHPILHSHSGVFRIIPFTFPVSISFHADRSPLLFPFLCYSRPYSNNSSALAPALPPFVPTLPRFWFFPFAVHRKKQNQEKVYF